MSIAEELSKKWKPVVVSIMAAIAAGAYYIEIKGSFSASIKGVVANPLDVAAFSIGIPKWGPHWVYRIFSEALTLIFATFVAAIVRRDSPRQGALIGGAAISGGYVILLGWFFYTLQMDTELRLIEPWGQQAIDAVMIIAAPLVGMAVGKLFEGEILRQGSPYQKISLYHLIWLWLPANWYALLLISPISRFLLQQASTFTTQPESSYFTTVITGLPVFTTVITGLPVYVAVLPLILGLDLLTKAGDCYGWKKTRRNLYGSIVLILGAIGAALFQAYWTKIIDYLIRIF